MALKHSGYYLPSNKLVSEYQTVSTLIGLFGKVQHAAIYKPSPELRCLDQRPEIKQCERDVYKALKAFEQEFARQVQRSTSEE